MFKKIFVIYTLATCTVFAQFRDVSCRFIYFSGQEKPPEIFAVQPEGGAIACSTPTAGLSDPKKFSITANALRLMTKDNALVSNAAIPPDCLSAIVIIVPTAKEPKREWRTIIIDDNKKVFPHGGAYMVNFNPTEIRFEIGEHKGRLKSGGHFGYEIPQQRSEFNMSPIVIWKLVDDKWMLVSESSARFVSTIRYLIVSYTDPVSSRPEVLRIKDLLER